MLSVRRTLSVNTIFLNRIFPRSFGHYKSTISDTLGELPSNDNFKTPRIKKELQNTLNHLEETKNDSVKFYVTLNRLDKLGYLDSKSNDYYLLYHTMILKNFRHILHNHPSYDFQLFEYCFVMLEQEQKTITRHLILSNAKRESIYEILASMGALLIENHPSDGQIVRYLEYINRYKLFASKLARYASYDKENMIMTLDFMKQKFLLNFAISRNDYFSAIGTFKSILEIDQRNSGSPKLNVIGCKDFFKFVNLAIDNSDSENVEFLIRQSRILEKSILLSSKQVSYLFKKTIFKKDILCFEILVKHYNYLLSSLPPALLVILLEKTKNYDVIILLLKRLNKHHSCNLQKTSINAIGDVYLRGVEKNENQIDNFLTILNSIDTSLLVDSEPLIERLFDLHLQGNVSSKVVSKIMGLVLTSDTSFIVKRFVSSGIFSVIYKNNTSTFRKIDNISIFVDEVSRSALDNSSKFELLKFSILSQDFLVHFFGKVCYNYAGSAPFIYRFFRKFISPESENLVLKEHPLKIYFDFHNVLEAIYSSGIISGFRATNFKMAQFFLETYLIRCYQNESSPKSLLDKLCPDLCNIMTPKPSLRGDVNPGHLKVPGNILKFLRELKLNSNSNGSRTKKHFRQLIKADSSNYKNIKVEGLGHLMLPSYHVNNIKIRPTDPENDFLRKMDRIFHKVQSIVESS
ncbi:hypothetical protein DASC09_061520 [Saccharomycopsis crataegensis]|uniref:Mitochondrial group I intron splicing factor CCM1 n=1 Tax=Saccharomycopsis crataegensis TaxID=43959 RepID=A0AAV5QVD5_9ASCO|nr:hypothetical protein DASC09_061520 [Saccharomycopsis crataegensis]